MIFFYTAQFGCVIIRAPPTIFSFHPNDLEVRFRYENTDFIWWEKMHSTVYKKIFWRYIFFYEKPNLKTQHDVPFDFIHKAI